MGLFDAFKKKAAPIPAAKAVQGTFSDLYSGMKVEVLTPANALVFIGKIRLLPGEVLEIRSESGGYIPRALYNQPVKLRCILRNGEAVTLNGTVAQNGLEFWRVENLKFLQSNENRSFFRQNISVDGFIFPNETSQAGKLPCKVLDISAGGARVRTDRLFPLNKTFRLLAAILPDEEPFSITCKVMRVMLRSDPGKPYKKYEYGCQFTDLPAREQDRLLQAIFILQRKALQARRDA